MFCHCQLFYALSRKLSHILFPCCKIRLFIVFALENWASKANSSFCPRCLTQPKSSATDRCMVIPRKSYLTGFIVQFRVYLTRIALFTFIHPGGASLLSDWISFQSQSNSLYISFVFPVLQIGTLVLKKDMVFLGSYYAIFQD